MIVFSGRAFLLLGAASIVPILAFADFTLLGWIVALDASIVALVVIDHRLARRASPGLTIALDNPLYQGETTCVRLFTRNESDRAVTIRFRTNLAPELSREPITRRVRIPAHAEWHEDLALTPQTRGDAELAPTAMRVLGPLGLAWRERIDRNGIAVRVFPRTHFDSATSLAIRQAMQRRVGFISRDTRGISHELYALRDYLPGDELRRIHWKQTARRRRPIVRETTWDQHQRIVVLLDCGRPMAPRLGALSKLDHAMASALALMRVVVAQQDAATLVLFSKEVRRVIQVDRRARSFASVFRRVYREEVDLDESNYGEVATWCARRIPRQSLVLLVTSVIDLVSAETVTTAALELSRRHRPLLVNLEDPAIRALLSEEPNDVVGSFALASALSIAESNRVLTARLRSRGIDVLSTPASRLTIGVIERYFAFKSRGYTHSVRVAGG